MELFLCIVFGWMGAHKFYKKKFLMGTLYLFTLGLFGLGWLYDTVILISNPKPRVSVPEPVHRLQPKYQTILVGTKYKNDDGTSRIQYIRGLEFVELVETVYLGDPAIRVEDKDKHVIGWVPVNDVERVLLAMKEDMSHVKLKDVFFNEDGTDCRAKIELIRS